MNPTTATDRLAPPPPADARDRLARNRERLSGWFEQDRQKQVERASSGWLAGVLLPVLKGLGTQPVASLALGALAQGMLQRTPGTPGAPLETQALDVALAVVRRHPKTSLTVAAIAGAALLWSRWHRRPSP